MEMIFIGVILRIKSNLITLRERKTRFIIAIKNLNKTASGTALTLISTVKNIKQFIKSITFDQGSEFNKYQWIKESVWITNPHKKCLHCTLKAIRQFQNLMKNR
jgi:IS30 family transposase